MRISEWLQKSIEKLESASVPTAKLDAEVLLADFLQKDRSWIHSNPEFKLDHQGGYLTITDEEIFPQGGSLRVLDGQVERRVKHEPIAYILGKKEFYGREFKVTSDTLQPRPETETMIELLLQRFQDSKFKILDSTIIDVGTGSGCIVISVALELSKILDSKYKITYLGVDISDKCLIMAQENTHKLSANVSFLKSDLLEDINVKNLSNSILLCNLPYVPDNFEVNEAAKFEPKIAILGGIDGLDYYRQLFEQIVSLPFQYRPSLVLTESLENQHEDLADIAEAHGYVLSETKDLIQVFEPIY